MTNKNETWIPKIDKDNLTRGFYYPLSTYTTLRERIKDVLVKGKHLLVDILPDNEYVVDPGENNHIKYIKVNTTDNRSIIIPIHDKCESRLESIKNSDQRMIMLDLEIHNVEINEHKIISIIYTPDNEIYMSIEGMHVISKLQPNYIEDVLIKSTTDKYIINKSRKRIKDKRNK